MARRLPADRVVRAARLNVQPGRLHHKKSRRQVAAKKIAMARERSCCQNGANARRRECRFLRQKRD